MIYIIITGNPVDGLVFIGPFASSDEAIAYGEATQGTDWWLGELHPAAEA